MSVSSGLVHEMSEFSVISPFLAPINLRRCDGIASDNWMPDQIADVSVLERSSAGKNRSAIA